MAQIDFTTVPVKFGEDQFSEVELPNFIQSAVIINNNIESSSDINTDEGDVFQCGKCKQQFSTFSTFLTHKKGNCLEKSTKVNDFGHIYTIPVIQYEAADDNSPIIIDNSEIVSLAVTPNLLCNQSAQVGEDNQCLANISSLKTLQIFNSGQNVQACTLIPRQYTHGKQNKPPENQLTNGSTETIVLSISENETNGIFKNTISYKLKCSYCGKEFRKKFDMDQHMRSHTGERPFQCIVCGRSFTQKSNVMKHMATHKVWPKKMFTLPTNPVIQVPSSENPVENKNPNDDVDIMIMNKTFVCQFCPCVFSSFLELKSHRKAHESQKVYKCIQKDCCATFKDLDAFLEHSQNHVNNGQYECRVCHRKFSSLANLGNHHGTHNKLKKSSSKTVTCRKCKSRFMSVESLNRHLSLESHRYPCTVCHRVFTCERFLRRHLLVHTNAAKYTCTLCNKSFKTDKYLEMHKTIHSNIKPFTCLICSASFNRKDKLARHNLTHENKKKFKCPFTKKMGCGKEFNRKDKLKEHILTHGAREKTLCHLGSNCLLKNVDVSNNCTSSQSNHKKCKEYVRPAKKLDHVNFKIIAQEDLTSSSINQTKTELFPGEDDNVPTIEIVVMPVTGHEADDKTFRVMIPPESATSIDLSNAFSDQQVPIYTMKPFK